MEAMANVDDGIFDMIGPRTLEGGYSPSQVISSAMKRAVEALVSSILGAKETWLTRVAVWAAGRNAEEMAMMAARRTRVSFAMFLIFSVCDMIWRKERNNVAVSNQRVDSSEFITNKMELRSGWHETRRVIA